jgi:uncharacterized delta-60 repeat protein
VITLRQCLSLTAALAGGLLTVAAPAPAWAATGALDPSFGDDGVTVTDVGGPAIAYGVARQPDGRIVAAGYSTAGGDADVTLARYDAAGRLDPSFGSGGVVRTDVRGAGGFDVGRAVALQPDGRIVVAGGSTATGPSAFAVLRYNPDGTPDRSFGTDGTVLTEVNGVAYGVTVQADGRIVAAGQSDTGGPSDITVVRYLPDGALDSGFGAAGVVRTDLGGNDQAAAVIAGAGGTITVAGTSDAAGSNDVAVVRYRPDGTPDPAFGTGGSVLTDVGNAHRDDTGRALALAPDGGVVVAGGSSAARGTDHDTLLLRYRPGGSLDRRFGQGGVALTDYGAGNGDDALAVAVLPDARIAVAGYAARPNARFLVARYRPDGRPDPGFGTGGATVTDVGRGAAAVAFGLAVQPDGDLIAAGYAGYGSFALARYRG